MLSGLYTLMLQVSLTVLLLLHYNLSPRLGAHHPARPPCAIEVQESTSASRLLHSRPRRDQRDSCERPRLVIKAKLGGRRGRAGEMDGRSRDQRRSGVRGR